MENPKSNVNAQGQAAGLSVGVPKPQKLIDRTREILRLRHYSIRTEEAYIAWMRRYILFHNKGHPKDMGQAEIEAFLTDLAVEGNVSASTQNQAFHALLFYTAMH